MVSFPLTDNILRVILLSDPAGYQNLAGKFSPSRGKYARCLTNPGVPVGQPVPSWKEDSGGITHRRLPHGRCKYEIPARDRGPLWA